MSTRWSVWGLLAGWFIVYALIWAFTTGDVGFAGDEWRIIGLAARYPMGQALNLSVYEALRPLQGVLPVLTYQVAGLHDVAYNAISALLHAGHVLAFAWAMRRAFQQRTRLIVIASLFVFHLPMLTYLLVNYNYDGVHTAALLYWLSVVAFQSWGYKQEYRRLILPIVLYTASLLTYENAFLLLPVTGLLVAAVINQRDRRPWRVNRLIGLAGVLGITYLISIALMIAIRSLWHVDLHSTPSFLSLDDLVNYGVVLIQHLQIPALPLAPDAIAIIMAVITAVVGTGLVMRAPAPMQTDERPALRHEGRWLVGVAVTLMIFGPLPYILAGYPTQYSFLGQSRYHALALIGIGILIGMMADALIRRRAQIIVYVGIALWLAFAAGFLFTFRLQYAQWEAMRQSLYRDLLTNVPAVHPPALILIQDGQFITQNMPILVFGGDNGLQSFLKVFYGTEDVHGGYINGTFTPDPTSKYVNPTALGWNAYLDRMVLLRREGDHLVMVPELTPLNGVRIDWGEGIDALTTNPNVIDMEGAAAQEQRLIELGVLKETSP